MFLTVELFGTVAFAYSGAMVAIKKELDLLGVVILGVITAVGGGMLRDVLLGHLPPTLFFHTIYTLTAFISVAVLFVLSKSQRVKLEFFHGAKFDGILNFVDAIGLGVFTASGAEAVRTAGYGDHWFLMITLGVLTGVGGGLLRDVLAGETPFIFQKDFYATASLFGAACYTMLRYYQVDKLFCLVLCANLVVILRVLARRHHWRLPKVTVSTAHEDYD